MFAQGAGIRVALGAAGDLTRVRFLQGEKGDLYMSRGENPRTQIHLSLKDRDTGIVRSAKLRSYLSAENDRIFEVRRRGKRA